MSWGGDHGLWDFNMTNKKIKINKKKSSLIIDESHVFIILTKFIISKLHNNVSIGC
jgi:hypothetical protein